MPTGITVMGLLAGAAGATVLTQMMKPDAAVAPAPATPAVTPPTAMPTPGDATTKALERASIAEQLRRRGRASTILTNQAATTDKLGG